MGWNKEANESRVDWPRTRGMKAGNKGCRWEKRNGEQKNKFIRNKIQWNERIFDVMTSVLEEIQEHTTRNGSSTKLGGHWKVLTAETTVTQLSRIVLLDDISVTKLYYM